MLIGTHEQIVSLVIKPTLDGALLLTFYMKTNVRDNYNAGYKIYALFNKI